MVRRVSDNSLYELIERLKSDGSDYRSENAHSWGLTDYLETLIKDGNLSDPAALGSAKQAIDQGVSSLTDNQIRAVALEMLNNDVYMDKCPNEWCGEVIAWGDMNIALHEGQCYHCVNREASIARQ
ncbi:MULTISPECIES: hypothetical protein [unclassified Bacillus cereus group]|uniref:hypothetical protein n=1 Tax=unclassified Bacillus cereus group TaxID=2750818 RepID=UPI0022E4B46F|nr:MULTISPECIES: hypothetical protein [unclassified Bacillus cereus group]MDA2146970.1 hypothetical protein [Bacillus cereus group sp. Bc248]MDA2174859.1 hypothetical protein [Bacillus cereus group sp. Bc247]